MQSWQEKVVQWSHMVMHVPTSKGAEIRSSRNRPGEELRKESSATEVPLVLRNLVLPKRDPEAGDHIGINSPLPSGVVYRDSMDHRPLRYSAKFAKIAAWHNSA